MNKDATLVVMAAGLGSRFGGGKQIAPIGPNGEIIVDFSVYDAAKSGFSKVVFIIKKEIEDEFRSICEKRMSKLIDVDFAFQDFSSIPSFYKIPEGRTKPYGTIHAVLCAKDKVNTPFVVINADDYYGMETFKIVKDYLVNNDSSCMAGFKLGNTLTDNGMVSRGVCEVENGFLRNIKEYKEIDKNSGISLDKTVSMNMWGFKNDIFEKMETSFADFLENISDPLKGEYILTDFVAQQINNGLDIKVLETPEKWYGITYKEDIPSIKTILTEYINQGKYLW